MEQYFVIVIGYLLLVAPWVPFVAFLYKLFDVGGRFWFTLTLISMAAIPLYYMLMTQLAKDLGA